MTENNNVIKLCSKGYFNAVFSKWYIYVCHGRMFSLVEFQILLVERVIGVSTGDLGIALGSEIKKLGVYSDLRGLGIALCTRM